MENTLFDGRDFDLLLGCKKIRHMLAFLKISLKKEYLDAHWAFGDDTVFFFVKMLDLPDADCYAGRIYALADYTTYIPYAEEGYKILDEDFKSRGESLEDWRFECFKKIISGVDLTPGKLQKIHDFFLARKSETVHANCIEETTSIVLRSMHCVEAAHAEPYWDGIMCDYFADNQTGLSGELLKEYAPPLPPLTAEQKEFVLSTKERIENLL